MVEMFGVLQETIMVHILQKFSVIFLSKLGKFVKVQGLSDLNTKGQQNIN